MELMSIASFAGSAFSTVCTAYFWLVKVRRERPLLKSHLVDREFYLGNGGAETRQIGLNLNIVVANYSILPNSILAVRAAVKKTDGGWQPVQPLNFDKQTPLPFNIPCLQTVLLRLNGQLTFPNDAKLEEGRGNQILTNYVKHHLAEPRQVKVELRGLTGWESTQVLGEEVKAAA